MCVVARHHSSLEKPEAKFLKEFRGLFSSYGRRFDSLSDHHPLSAKPKSKTPALRIGPQCRGLRSVGLREARPRDAIRPTYRPELPDRLRRPIWVAITFGWNGRIDLSWLRQSQGPCAVLANYSAILRCVSGWRRSTRPVVARPESPRQCQARGDRVASRDSRHLD